MYAKKDKIYNAYVSKHNSNNEKHVILSMMSKGKKESCHYLAVKMLSEKLQEKLQENIKRNYIKK